MTTDFEKKYGFKREEFIIVPEKFNLADWRTTPYNRWSFQNISEIFRCAKVHAQYPEIEQPKSMDSILSETINTDGGEKTIEQILGETHTDNLTIMKNGEFVFDWWADNSSFNAPHIVFSVSKSVTAIVAGIVIEKGLLDPDAMVIDYIPEAKNGAYADATVQNVLDMEVSLDFVEDYYNKDPESLFNRYNALSTWGASFRKSDETLTDLLCNIQKGKNPHGYSFQYITANTDMIRLLIEKVSGERLHTLLQNSVLKPIQTRNVFEISINDAGEPRAGVSMCFAPRDLARIGELMRNKGVAENGERIISERWVNDTLNNGSEEKWNRQQGPDRAPGGCYRNQWYQSNKGYFFAAGVHGQFLMVHPEKQMVIAKFGSQPEPIGDDMRIKNYALFEALFEKV